MKALLVCVSPVLMMLVLMGMERLERWVDESLPRPVRPGRLTRYRAGLSRVRVILVNPGAGTVDDVVRQAPQWRASLPTQSDRRTVWLGLRRSRPVTLASVPTQDKRTDRVVP